MKVGSGSSPLRGLENRRPKGYAGSSPVPSATFFSKTYIYQCHLN
jgi:hypothetical protein